MPVCRPHQLHEPASESVPDYTVRPGLFAGEIHAANSASRDGAGQSRARYYPIKAAENRSGDYSKYLPHKIAVLQGVS